MKTNIFIGGLFLLVVGIFPALTFAQVTLPDMTSTAENLNKTVDTIPDDPKSPFFQLVSCDGVDDPRTPNKIETECTFNEVVKTFERIIKFVLYLMIPIVLGMIVYVGFTYLTANGDSGKLAKAKSMITPLLLGVFFMLAAWLIVYTLLDFLLAENLSDGVDGIKKSDIIPAKN